MRLGVQRFRGWGLYGVIYDKFGGEAKHTLLMIAEGVRRAADSREEDCNGGVPLAA